VFRRSLRLGVGLVAIMALAACGGSTSQAPSGGGSSGEPCSVAAVDADFAVDVNVKDFAPSPDPASIKVGETVRWTNQDSATHAFAIDDHPACATSSLAQGAIGKITFTQAGTYTYHCTIHADMKGYTITVTAG
jgi:plastocyanin